MPRADTRTPANKDFGKPGVSFPWGSKAYPTFVTTYAPRQDQTVPAFLDAYTSASPGFIQVAGVTSTTCKLTGVNRPEGDNQQVNITLRYEALPGPVITTSRIDEDAMNVIIGVQKDTAPAVDAAIVVNETLTGSGPYVWTRKTKGQGDVIVANLITETRAIPGNAVGDYLYDTLQGATQHNTQLIRTADIPGGGASLAESGGVVTKLQYLNVPGSLLVSNKSIDTFTLAGCVSLTRQVYDEPSNTFTLITRTLKKTSDIVEGITLVNATDDTITLIESEPVDAVMSIEVATTWTEPVARDSSTQIITSQNAGPKQFPFVIYDPDLWIISNGLLGSTPKFTTTDNTFTTKTFWTFSATEPDLTLDGILRPATIDSFLGFLGISPAGDVIVDGGADYFVGGVTITISASTPSATVYLSDYVGGSPRSVDGQVKMDTNRYRWRTDRQFMQFIIQARPVYT